MTALKAAIRDAFPAEINRFAVVARAEARPVGELLPGEVLKRGNNIFGLDLEYVRRQGKLEALKTIVLGMVTSDARLQYGQLKSSNPAAADQLMERWLSQREPLGDDLNTLMMIDGAALSGLQASLLNGDLPLDGSINLPTVLLLQDLSKRGGERAIGELIDANAGFANPNPGENYIISSGTGSLPRGSPSSAT